MVSDDQRVFLFLQGPHGPFIRALAKEIGRRGHRVQRVAFNAGDEAEWADAGPLYRFGGPLPHLAHRFRRHIVAEGVTDVVLYGDTRPTHRIAREISAGEGVTTHCLEEGYIRPSWITYEREGNNGNSRLMSLSVPRMARALEALSALDPGQNAPAVWGDARQHIWHSTLYHARSLAPNGHYRHPARHRDLPLLAEGLYYAIRGLQAPVRGIRRAWQHRSLLRSGQRYHLVLLQLSFDASMQVHSDYRGTVEFIEHVIGVFSRAAPSDEYLVLKAHPFEDGRERLASKIRRAARAHGVSNRVIFIDGGAKLAELLDGASSAITVNSTAAQQALARGLPLAALGRAVYRKPGLVSEQTLPDFIRRPQPPDIGAYRVFRRFLMATSQVAGSYYSAAGRARLLQVLPDIILDPVDPYDRVLSEQAKMPEDAPLRRQTLRAVG